MSLVVVVGRFLNCLHCYALALLLHSAIKWSIQCAEKKRGGCGISKSEMLASECDPQGKRRGRRILVVLVMLVVGRE